MAETSREVPPYDIFEFAPKRRKYCVTTPVINEGERIRTQLRKMKPLSESVDILIADGGSTDGSLEHDFLKENSVRTLLVKKGPGGLSTQMRMALDYALNQGYEGFVFVDGNNKDDTAAVLNFIKHLDQGYDHIQGSRFIKGGKHTNTPLSRYLAVRLIHAPLMSITSGFWHTDTTNGFRAYSKRLVTDPRVNPFRSIMQGYELHAYMAHRAARLKLRVTEIPVTREYPPKAKAPTKITPVIGNTKYLVTLTKTCLGLLDP